MKHLITAILLVTALTATAVKTATKLKVKPLAEALAVCDTVALPPTDSVLISGYDKPLRSRSETFFITNRYSRDTLDAIDVRIEYTDLKGRRLHSREQRVECGLVPGDTRNFSIRSWDKQCSFYYRLSNAPRRAKGTPYDVRFVVERAFVRGGAED